MDIVITNETGIDSAAQEFPNAISTRRHIALHAPMGAGKTTFTSAICRVLGVTDDVNSPTFSIINEYRDRDGNAIYHFDFYRIDTPEQALDLGLDEYFDTGALCLMEWPENVADFLPEDTLDVCISVDDEGVRTLSFDS